MDIEIYSGDTKAIVSTQGAWITNVSNLDGDILFPKRRFVVDGKEKYRGGCHVCVPQFGPDASGNLAQHGFARDVMWEVFEQTTDSLTLVLKGEGDYVGLEAELAVTVLENGLSQQLTLRNIGNSALRVSPAFHPYFALGSDREAVLNGEALELNELKEAVFKSPHGAMQLRTNNRVLSLASDGLPTWAVWTDSLAPYVCVEPTEDGFAFASEPLADQQINRGEERSFGFYITW